MQEFEIIFYALPDGREPVREFLNSLDAKMRSKLLRSMALLQENGNALREPYSKSLNDGIFEIRAKVGSNISRILYFFFDGQKIILTNGFIKKTQNTPSRELARAQTYRKDYFKRKGNLQ